MKAILSLFVVIVLGLNSCLTISGERGNGDIQSREFDIEDYSAVRLSGSKKMIYEQKDTEKPYLRIEIDENLLPYLNPVVENGCLNLKSTKNINPTKYVIYTNSTSLKKADLSGSGQLSLESDIESGQLDVSISGSGKIVAGNIRCQGLKSSISGSGSLQIDSLYGGLFEIATSGSGKIKAAGVISESNIGISGSGLVDIKELVSEKSTTKISGSGKVNLNVTKELDAKVSGSGSVYYTGNPEVKKISTSGSGKVKAE